MTDYTPTAHEVFERRVFAIIDDSENMLVDSRRKHWAHQIALLAEETFAAHDKEVLWAAAQRIDAHQGLIGVNRYGENETDVEYGPAIWKEDAVSCVMRPVWDAETAFCGDDAK
jgi:hypothetical protein